MSRTGERQELRFNIGQGQVSSLPLGLAEAGKTFQRLRVYESPVVAEGTVIRIIKPGLFEIELPNGKITLGHFSKALATADPELLPGGQVTLELTPFDFDSARIAAIASD